MSIYAIYDCKTKRLTSDPSRSGLVGFMSYSRLLEVLYAAAEFRPTERVTHIEIGDDGLQFRITQTSERAP